MERISIFNYEAFYLDYLEGNLNEEDTALLMAFFEENPDLRMDDMELPTYSAEEIKLDATSKDDLKQYAEDEVITLENAEFFMIAQMEGLLGDRKSEELAAFVAENNLTKESGLYSVVTLEPELELVYDDKEGLKEKRVVLWPYYATGVAAACIIAFFMLWSDSSEGMIDGNSEVFADQNDEFKILPHKVNNQVPVQVEENAPVYVANSTDIAQESNVPVPSESTHEDSQNRTDEKPEIQRLSTRPAHPIIASVGDLKPISHNFDVDPDQPGVTRTDYATTAFADMENPIEPVTDFVQDKTKRQVDFRRQKKTKNKPGGFFLKIGNFEVSHKKH